MAQKLRLYRHDDTQSFSGSSVCLRMEVYGCKFYTSMWYVFLFIDFVQSRTQSQKYLGERGILILWKKILEKSLECYGHLMFK
jgi:hypothetical protein